MNLEPLTGDQIHRAFEQRAGRPLPIDLRGNILAATGTTAQDRSWLADLRALLDRPAVPRIMVLALLSVAVVGTVIGVGGGRQSSPAPSPAAVVPLLSDTPIATAPVTPPPSPRPTASPSVQLITPFSYRIPAGSGLTVVEDRRGLFALTVGSVDPFGRDNLGGTIPGSRGITVSAFDMAHTHPCPGQNGGSSRVPVRIDPAGFLADLEAIGGVGIVGASPTTFDGRPAMAAAIDPTRSTCDSADFHIQNAAPDYVLLPTPARVRVAEVADWTVVVHIWAASPDDLTAWLPTAEAFVASMHFEE